MMVSNEQEDAQKEQRCTVINGDAQQKAEPPTAPGDSATGGAHKMGSGSGSVYFIRSPDGAFMKIGYTAGPVLARFTQICNGLPGLQLVGYLPGSRDTEFWLHAKFRGLQENGEWFRSEPELLSFMGAIGLIVPKVQIARRPVMRKRINPAVVFIDSPASQTEPEPVGLNQAAASLGRSGGRARAHSLSPEVRREIARQGGLAKADKNAAAVALGRLAASKRTKEELAEAGRRGMASRWGGRK